MRPITLTITCPDTVGIVAAVSGFLSEHDVFIAEAAQYGDPVTRRFFMRCVFTLGVLSPPKADLEKRFSLVAQRFQMIWHMHDGDRPARVVILVSRLGHCLNDLLHRQQSGALPIDVAAVISNHPDLQRLVEWHHIPFHHLPVGKTDKVAREESLGRLLEEAEPDLVVLARYMQILSPGLCAKLSGRCINIHHSFLPSFKGARPYHQAYERGVKLIGATAHYVTTDLDEGPIIDQAVERVDHHHLPEDLVAMGRDMESVVLARAVRYHIEHRVLINGRKTVVFN